MQFSRSAASMHLASTQIPLHIVPCMHLPKAPIAKKTTPGTTRRTNISNIQQTPRFFSETAMLSYPLTRRHAKNLTSNNAINHATQQCRLRISFNCWRQIWGCWWGHIFGEICFRIAHWHIKQNKQKQKYKRIGGQQSIRLHFCSSWEGKHSCWGQFEYVSMWQCAQPAAVLWLQSVLGSGKWCWSVASEVRGERGEVKRISTWPITISTQVSKLFFSVNSFQIGVVNRF